MAKNVHIYCLNPASSYGGEFRINNLVFYDKNDNKIPVTDVARVSAYDATFKVNGIAGRVHVASPYVSPPNYDVVNVFKTEMSVYSTLMVQNNNSATLENKGFWLYFDSNFNFSYLTLAWHYTAQPKDFMIVVDGKEAKDVVNQPSKATLFKLYHPVIKIRCLLGKNKHYYFLRPKDKVIPSAPDGGTI